MGLDFLCCKTKSKVITITDDSNNISTSVSGRFVQNEVKRKTKIANKYNKFSKISGLFLSVMIRNIWGKEFVLNFEAVQKFLTTINQKKIKNRYYQQKKYRLQHQVILK